MSDAAQPGFYRMEEFLALPCDPEIWVIHPILPLGGWANLYGEPKKARKSYFALGAAWAVSSRQTTWLSFSVREGGPVLYLQADTPHPLWRQRLEDIISGGYDLSNMWAASLNTIPYPFNLDEHEETLAQMIEDARQEAQEEPKLIIYDTGRKLHLRDENSSQEMTLIMNALDRVSGRHMAKLLITHDKKGSSQPQGNRDEDKSAEGGDLMKGARGSSAVAGAVDTVMKITPKGYLYYQGRAVGETHRPMQFTHVHDREHPCPHANTADCMGWAWTEDIPPIVTDAQKLIRTYRTGSERSLARLLARMHDVEEERARAIIRRQKERGIV